MLAGVEILKDSVEVINEVRGWLQGTEVVADLDEVMEAFAWECRALAAAGSTLDRLYCDLMLDMARLGIKMARQRLITEFVALRERPTQDTARSRAAGDTSQRRALKLRQRKITDFFKACEG